MEAISILVLIVIAFCVLGIGGWILHIIGSIVWGIVSFIFSGLAHGFGCLVSIVIVIVLIAAMFS